MKVKRLILCLLLSVALTVTFVPCIAFADDGDPGDSGESGNDYLTPTPIGLNETVSYDENVTGPYGETAFLLTFTPSETGIYEFYSEDEADESGFHACKVMDSSDTVIGADWLCTKVVKEYGEYYDRPGFSAFFEASAGETYQLYFEQYECCSFKVSVKKSNITGISFTPAGQYIVDESCSDYGTTAYWDHILSFNSGDKLTIKTTVGSKTYACKTLWVTDIDGNKGDYLHFVNTADSSDVLFDPCFDIDSGYAPKATYKAGSVKTLNTSVDYGVWSANTTIKIKFIVYHMCEKYVKAKAPTCKVAGNKAYWICSDCGKYFLDEEGQKEVTKSSLTIPKAHKWKHGKVAGGLLKNGSEYDQCVYCKAKKNTKVIPGYSEYYVKSFKVKKGKKSFTAKWKKQSKKNLKKFNGYQIRYSTNANMSKAKFATAGKKSKSKKIKGLAKKTTYYVQVRTYTKANGSTFYSKWSAKKKVKTK